MISITFKVNSLSPCAGVSVLKLNVFPGGGGGAEEVGGASGLCCDFVGSH